MVSAVSHRTASPAQIASSELAAGTSAADMSAQLLNLVQGQQNDKRDAATKAAMAKMAAKLKESAAEDEDGDE